MLTPYTVPALFNYWSWGLSAGVHSTKCAPKSRYLSPVRMNDCSSPVKTVLVYIDTRGARPLSDVVKHIEHLVHYCVSENARLILCDAVAPPQTAGNDRTIHGRLPEMRRRFAKAILGKLCDQAAAGIDVECLVLKGKPVAEICRIVAARNIALLVTLPVPTEPENLDSPSMHLLRKCPCQIWVVRQVPQRERTNERISPSIEIFFRPEMDRNRSSAT